MKNGRIGIVIDMWKRHALTDSEEDKALERDEDERNWKFYFDPVLKGSYSDYILTKLEEEGTLMDIKPGDLEMANEPIDYFGLNVYNRVVVSKDQKAIMDFSQGGNFLNNRTEYYPKAVYDALHILKDKYNLRIPVYITENGTYSVGEEKVNEKTGMIEDDDRIRYVSGFFSWLEKAIDEGFDVRGYYLWTLMDNFEWSAGSNYRFGIIHTDFDTCERTWKKSAYWFRDYINSKR